MSAIPFRCIIVDDEPGAIASLEALLKNHPELLVTGSIQDPASALDIILSKKPDLLFLDIQMPGMSGFDIARSLGDAGFLPAIIFVTAFDSFAIEAIRHSAFDFLLKPVNPRELNAALQRFMAGRQVLPAKDQFTRLVERVFQQPKLKIRTAGGFTLIDPREIFYIRADWNYSEIFVGGGKSELCTLNIGALEEMLPPHGFFRISRSLIINVNYLVKVSRKRRQATLVKAGEEITFPIPLLNIRKLENFLA